MHFNKLTFKAGEKQVISITLTMSAKSTLRGSYGNTLALSASWEGAKFDGLAVTMAALHACGVRMGSLAWTEPPPQVLFPVTQVGTTTWDPGLLETLNLCAGMF